MELSIKVVEMAHTLNTVMSSIHADDTHTNGTINTDTILIIVITTQSIPTALMDRPLRLVLLIESNQGMVLDLMRAKKHLDCLTGAHPIPCLLANSYTGDVIGNHRNNS